MPAKPSWLHYSHRGPLPTCHFPGTNPSERPADADAGSGVRMAPVPWASTVVTCLSPGTLKTAFFFFASVCAWYSGYLLAELIPEVSLTSAVYSIRSIAEKPRLKGEYHSSAAGCAGSGLSSAPAGHFMLMMMMMVMITKVKRRGRVEEREEEEEFPHLSKVDTPAYPPMRPQGKL